MSQTLFFYGTLCHIPLLEIVLGRDRAQIDMRAASLQGHHASWVTNEPFPMIAAQAGARAEGVLVQGLSAQDLARLRFYEGGFEYDLKPVTVTSQNASFSTSVFFPDDGVWRAGHDWDLADWVSEWGPISERAAREVMAQFGVKSAKEIAHLLPFLRARGWAKELANKPMAFELRRSLHSDVVKVAQRGDGYAGFFRLETFDISYPRFDGTLSETSDRAAFVAYDAALVLPYDPVRDLVLLIEQLRYGPVLRGDPQPWVLEPIAGLVDAGEAPIETARREAAEEAGLDLQDIRPMMSAYPSPGYSTEYFHSFLALCDLDPSLEGTHGLQSENEDIRTHVVTFDRAMELLDRGEINVAPLMGMLLWLHRQRDKIRSLT